MNIYLNAVESTSNKKNQLIPLSTLSKHGSFSSKYLNLLVRSGKLEAHKEGRIWLSSKKVLNEYLENRERKRPQNEKKRSRAKTAKF